MERLVEHEEFVRVACRLALFGQDSAQLIHRGLADALAGAPRDRAFHRLAHEARVGHGFCGNLDHEGTALRQHAHQSDLGQLDEGLAHRLAAHIKPAGDVLLGQRGRRRQLHGDDRGAQRVEHLLGD